MIDSYVERLIPPSALAAIREHARACYPEECCGVVSRDGAYHACSNVGRDRRKQFRLADADYLALADQAAVIIHSHADGPAWPTKIDMEQQIASALPWGLVVARADGGVRRPIVWGAAERAPLLGRPFINGVWDCYSLIRDWYWLERRIDLPEYPREPNWWRSGGNLYAENFAAAGFRAIGAEEARPGDVVLMRVNNPGVPDHGGVLLEGGLMLHHLGLDIPSRRVPFGPWSSLSTHYLRHMTC